MKRVEAVSKRLVIVAVMAVLMGTTAFAQIMHPPETKRIKPPGLENVGIDQKLNEQLPLELTFRDESGRTVKLGDYFHSGRPVLLNFVYYQCPMLCGEVLNGVSAALKVLKFMPGKEFEVVTISIDPREKPELAAAKKQSYMERLGRPEAAKGWHFLTGDREQIEKLTNAAGWHYQYDPKLDQFAHAAGIMLVTPQGKLAQYYYGVEYSARDLRLGIIEASQDKIGSLADQVLLYCYHYDPKTGKYGAVITNIMRLGGLVTVACLGIFLVLMFRRETHDQRDARGRA